jgi:acetyl esterase/lipase
LYVPAVVRKPNGRGPFPAAICIHGGSGGLGISYLVDEMLNHGYVLDRFLAEGYAVVFTEGRMEIEEAYGTSIPASLDHNDLVAIYHYIRQQSFVDPQRVAFFGISHGGEMQMKLISEIQDGPAALVPGEPAVIEYLGLRYTEPRVERNLQFNADIGDEQIDFERAWQRIQRISPSVPILVIGRDGDHLQGLFRKLYDLLKRAGKDAHWATWAHPEHAYQWGPRRGDGGYQVEPLFKETLDYTVAFLNKHVRDRQ